MSYKYVKSSFLRKDNEQKETEREAMKKSDHGLEIRRVTRGFVIKDNEGNETVAKENESEGLSVAEDLLNEIIEFFGLRGGRYDRERIRVVREVGDKYTPQKDEKIVREHFSKVKSRQNTRA